MTIYQIPQYYVEGNHEAIVSPEVYDMVQREMESRCKNKRHSGVHMFSGKIRCGNCGSWYGSKVWHSTDKYRKVIWQCNHKFSREHRCTTPHLTDEDVQRYFVSAVNQLFSQKDTVLKSLDAGLKEAFDLTDLLMQEENQTEKVQMLADAVEKCIFENAHVVMNQDDYQQRYDDLVARYDAASDKLKEISSLIADKKARRDAVQQFMKTLKKQNDLITEFEPKLWCSLVEYMTVYAEDDVRITFKNGMEIKA